MDQNTVIIFLINLAVSALAGAITASFRIGEYKNRVDNLETTVGKDDHNGLRKTVGDIKDRIIACETELKLGGPLTKKKSPISLTERGVNLLKNSGGEKFVDDNFAELMKKVDDLEPKTSYDVQELSKSVIESLREDDRLNTHKEFLFRDGSTLEDLFTVMSIYLRDKILKHKSWNADDIDHQNPKK